MAVPYLSEIKLMSFNFAPKGWTQCNGQLLPINQNQALFSLLGTNYGGNGQTTFGLPDLRAAIPMHWGGSHPTLGEKGGENAHTLSQSEMPAHSHVVNADNSTASSNQPTPTAFLANSTPPNVWGAFSGVQPMLPAAIGNAGGSQPHENRMPSLVLNFCIALVGIFPSRN